MATIATWPGGRGELGALAFIQSLGIAVDTEKAKACAQWLESEDVGCTSAEGLAAFDLSFFTGSPVPLTLRTVMIAKAREVCGRGGAESSGGGFAGGAHQETKPPQAPHRKVDVPVMDSLEVLTLTGLIKAIEELGRFYTLPGGGNNKAMASDLFSLCKDHSSERTEKSEDENAVLSYYVMTGMKMPKSLKAIIDDSSAGASDGFEQIRELLLDYSTVSDISADGLQNFFRKYTPLAGHLIHTLQMHLEKWRVLRARLKEMGYEQNRLDCIQSLRSMCVNIPDCVAKFKEMQSRLDKKTREKLDLDMLIDEFKAIAKDLSSDHHVRSELSGGARANSAAAAVADPTDGFEKPESKSSKKKKAKALKAAIEAAAKLKCYHWTDFGYCNKQSSGCDKSHLDVECKMFEKESHFNGNRLCPFHRRHGTCRQGAGCSMMHLENGLPVATAVPHVPHQPAANSAIGAIMGQPVQVPTTPTAVTAPHCGSTAQRSVNTIGAIREAVRESSLGMALCRRFKAPETPTADPEKLASTLSRERTSRSKRECGCEGRGSVLLSVASRDSVDTKLKGDVRVPTGMVWLPGVGIRPKRKPCVCVPKCEPRMSDTPHGSHDFDCKLEYAAIAPTTH